MGERRGGCSCDDGDVGMVESGEIEVDFSLRARGRCIIIMRILRAGELTWNELFPDVGAEFPTRFKFTGTLHQELQSEVFSVDVRRDLRPAKPRRLRFWRQYLQVWQRTYDFLIRNCHSRGYDAVNRDAFYEGTALNDGCAFGQVKDFVRTLATLVSLDLPSLDGLDTASVGLGRSIHQRLESLGICDGAYQNRTCSGFGICRRTWELWRSPYNVFFEVEMLKSFMIMV